jgi:hypothetical protein
VIYFLRSYGMPVVLLVLLAGCTRPLPPTELADMEADSASGAEEPGALAPGRYCYGINSETLTGVVRLTLQENQRVTGDSSFTIHNEEVGYFSSYMQELEGLLDQNQASLDITTWIEYDVQNSEAVWTLTPTTLTTDTNELTAMDCSAARERFVGADGLDASELLAGVDEADTESLEFPLGESTLTHQGELAAGEKAAFELYREGGQSLEVTVDAFDDAVTFDLIAPSGLILARSEQSASVLLPHTGWQTIVVSSGDKDAITYELRIAQ